MIKHTKKDVVYLTFKIFEPYKQLIAVHSTRIGGVSKGHFKSMNLGFQRGDIKEDVTENYKRFSDAIGVDYKKMVLSDQWHHNHILEATEVHCGMGVVKARDYGDVDGVLTTHEDLPIVTFYADCVPIYFFDPINDLIGMTHAGWRGTSTAIVKDMVDRMIEKGSKKEAILVGIGPAICKSCYQVDQTVIDAMKFNFDVSKYYDYVPIEDRYYIDLKNINKAILMHHGIEEANIEVTDYCTKCHDDLFFSHRRYGNNRGTQIGVMMLEG